MVWASQFCFESRMISSLSQGDERQSEDVITVYSFMSQSQCKYITKRQQQTPAQSVILPTGSYTSFYAVILWCKWKIIFRTLKYCAKVIGEKMQKKWYFMNKKWNELRQKRIVLNIFCNYITQVYVQVSLQSLGCSTLKHLTAPFAGDK